MGMPHEDLFMAVLVQPVVEAEYAFVIHTVNPSSGNANELFAEVVLGLGETLVGNYPGRALSVVWDKTTEKQTLLSYPSKSIGLYGRGLIFRSDSNGEDLAGYAGAGLYDSILLRRRDRSLLTTRRNDWCGTNYSGRISLRHRANRPRNGTGFWFTARHRGGDGGGQLLRGADPPTGRCLGRE